MKYIGIDVGGTNLVAGVVDETGMILDKVSHPVDKNMSAEDMCRELARMARGVLTVSGISAKEIAAVGVGLPGLVDNKTGMVIKTPNMPFNRTPFRELFQKEWDVPVYLGNDANCAAIGEYFAGAAKSSNNAVVVTIGTGLGGGLVVDGKLLTGFANAGMEVGHMIIHPNGMMCGCGQRGCWEQYGSATALIRLTRIEMERNKDTKLWEVCEFDKKNITGRTAFQAARLGDAAAQRVLAQYLEGLSIGLINLVNILQPEIICLGGGVSNAEDDLLLDPLRKLVAQGVFDKHVPVRLEKASLGNDAGIVGAALLCETI